MAGQWKRKSENREQSDPRFVIFGEKAEKLSSRHTHGAGGHQRSVRINLLASASGGGRGEGESVQGAQGNQEETGGTTRTEMTEQGNKLTGDSWEQTSRHETLEASSQGRTGWDDGVQPEPASQGISGWDEEIQPEPSSWVSSKRDWKSSQDYESLDQSGYVDVGYHEQQMLILGSEVNVRVAYTAKGVEDWIDRCPAGELHFGFDIEWRPNFQRGEDNYAALCQLSSATRCLIVQLLYIDFIPDKLKALLADPQVKLAGVGIKGDINKIFEDYGLKCRGEVDLGNHAATILQDVKLKQAGLATLCSAILGLPFKKSKKVTMSNWGVQGLSYGQIVYAATDAWIAFSLLTALEKHPSYSLISGIEKHPIESPVTLAPNPPGRGHADLQFSKTQEQSSVINPYPSGIGGTFRRGRGRGRQPFSRTEGQSSVNPNRSVFGVVEGRLKTLDLDVELE